MRNHYSDTSSEEEEGDSEPIIVRKRNVRIITTKNSPESPVMVAVASLPASQVFVAGEEAPQKRVAAEAETAKRAEAFKSIQEAARQKQQEAIAKAKAQAAQLQAAAKQQQENARRQVMAEAAQRQAAVQARTDAAAEQRAVKMVTETKQMNAAAKTQLENLQREKSAIRAQQEAIRAQTTQTAMLQTKKLTTQQDGQNGTGQRQRPGSIMKPINSPIQTLQQEQQSIANIKERQQPERSSAFTPIQQLQAQRGAQPTSTPPLSPVQTSITSKTIIQQQNRILNPTAIRPQSIADVMKTNIDFVSTQKTEALKTMSTQKPIQIASTQRQTGFALAQKQIVVKPTETVVAPLPKQSTIPGNRFEQNKNQKVSNSFSPIKQTNQSQKPAPPKVSTQTGSVTRGVAETTTQVQQVSGNNTDATASKKISKFKQISNSQLSSAPASSLTASQFSQKPIDNVGTVPVLRIDQKLATNVQKMPSKTTSTVRGQTDKSLIAQAANQTTPVLRFDHKETVLPNSAVQNQSSAKVTPKQTVQASRTAALQSGSQRVAQKYVELTEAPKLSQPAPSFPTKGAHFNSLPAQQLKKTITGFEKPVTVGAPPTYDRLTSNPETEDNVTWIVDKRQQGKFRTLQQTAAPSPVLVPAPFLHADSETVWDGSGFQSSLSSSSIPNRVRMTSVDPDSAPKKKVVIDDEIWLAQRRVPQEQVAPYQPERIQIPEFIETVEVKPTVIVSIPTETTRVKWEFPEPEDLGRETVPKVKAQDWVPQNEVEHVVTKTTYAPSKIGQVWPPPNWATTEESELMETKRTKATEDEAWIQHGFPSEQAVGTNLWSQNVSGSGVRERQWPPSPNELAQRELTASSKGLFIQWPPSEFGEQKQAEIEIIQTHLPVKANRRQWPPPQHGNEESMTVVA